ncbi:hypothetical protein VNI00_016734, partial [Paramarasmius palmivorus]
MPKNKRARDIKRFTTKDNLVRPETSITSTTHGIIQKRINVKPHVLPSPQLLNISHPGNDSEICPLDQLDFNVINAPEMEPEVKLSPGEEPGRVKVKKPRTKQYEDSDTLILGWLEKHREEYLEWCFATEERGRLFTGKCTTAECLGQAVYWCTDCLSFGLFCKNCMVKAHQQLPCHRIETWNNNFFSSTSLQELGLCVQLGHLGGTFCDKPQFMQKFVILDVNGIHTLDIAFCGCSDVERRNQLLEFGMWPTSYKEPQSAATFNLLRNFHIMNLKGHIPPTDYYHALTQMSNGDGLSPPPDRLAQFRTVIQEWRHIKMGKCAGRGHDPLGLAGTPNGGAMVLCRACPQPGMNLPPGWESAPPEMQFLYALIVSIDANFKQKARGRPGDKSDPILGPGFGCFVPNAQYMDEISKQTDQEEIPSNTKIIFKVPKFHLPAHTEKCHAPYALEYTEGVGDTDGEAPERNWSELNVSARSLSMMTSGARFDTTDDICNDWNHEKTLDLAHSLLKKLVKGISNLVVYSRAFTTFTEALKHQHGQNLQQWEKQVVEWEQGHSKNCPYEMPTSSITMAKVKKVLADEEHQCEKCGQNRTTRSQSTHGPGESTSTLSGLMIELLDIEEVQRQLSAISSLSTLTLYQKTDLQTRRTALLKRIHRMRDNQFIHLPALQKAIDAIDKTNLEPEELLLHPPSSITQDQLRYAQSFEALSNLRGLLRARTVAYQHSQRVSPSQRTFTKLNALQTQLEVKIRSICGMYRTARAALLTLRGPGEWESTLKELKAEDIRGIGERVAREEDMEMFRESQKRAGVDSKEVEKILRGEVTTLLMIFVDPSISCNSQKNNNISWIWYTYGESGSVGQEGVNAKEVEA